MKWQKRTIQNFLLIRADCSHKLFLHKVMNFLSKIGPFTNRFFVNLPSDVKKTRHRNVKNIQIYKTHSHFSNLYPVISNYFKAGIYQYPYYTNKNSYFPIKKSLCKNHWWNHLIKIVIDCRKQIYKSWHWLPYFFVVVTSKWCA